MDEKIQFVVDDEIVDEVNVSESTDVSEVESGDNGIGVKLLAGGVAVAGIAAGVVWKKFGPTVKAKAKELKIKRLTKKNERLANKQLSIQAKLNQMRSTSEEAKKE